MRDRFEAHLASFPPPGTVLVGFSGGGDSTCLLHLLHAAGVDVVAAHLNHGQRPEADAEQAQCEAFADSLGVPFVGGKADVPALAARFKIGLEEAGRKARYEFFRQAAHRLNCHRIATAHTRDDQLETILLNLARGTGLAGLVGIPEWQDDLWRPLLPFSRSETRAYCEANGLAFLNDPANEDPTFARVRARQSALPSFRALHPGAEASLLRLSQTAREEDQFLDSAAAALLEQTEIPINGALNFLTRDCEAVFGAGLRHAPPVLRRRALRLAVRFLGAELDFDQTRLPELNASGSLTCEGGQVLLEWDPEQFHVRFAEPDAPFRFPLTVPGETEAPSFGWVLEAREATAVRTDPRDSLETELDPAGLVGNLFFRSAEPGDRLIPRGFDHERKVSDLLSEAKLTLAARRRLPIICDMMGAVWIPGVCAGQRACPAETGGRAIRLKLRPMAQNETAGGI